jgi:hypothetical protein
MFEKIKNWWAKTPTSLPDVLSELTGNYAVPASENPFILDEDIAHLEIIKTHLFYDHKTGSSFEIYECKDSSRFSGHLGPLQTSFQYALAHRVHN